MSTLVLHMSKFKKDAVRGIQSHNRRERESHSNPDIDYSRSSQNCEFCATSSSNYMQTIQTRIDDLLMVKAIRKDAVHMCGLVVSSDKEFFDNLSPEETKRFFEEAQNYLTEFVGKENVISAMAHMDEKTPHMHFLHVPITKDGRLCAKDIYTKTTLKKLQDELPKFLQQKGFLIERGVEQTQGSAKKHLDTKEFKQQQEMLKSLQAETENLKEGILALQIEITNKKLEEAEINERIERHKKLVADAEEKLLEKSSLRPANFFNYKEVLKEAECLINTFKQALADKQEIAEERDMRIRQANSLLWQKDEAVKKANEIISMLNAEREEFAKIIKQWKKERKTEVKELECLRSFVLLNGLVDRYGEFMRQRQTQKASGDEAQARQQSSMGNSYGGQRMR